MAISLKNIEDRVTVLEALTNESVVYREETFNVTNTLDLSSVFDSLGTNSLAFIMFSCYTTQNVYGMVNVGGCIVRHKGTTGSIEFTHKSDINYAISATISSNGVTTWTTNGKVTKVKGYYIVLKLYYNFSYNIIYKILSSIKFKISQIISSLKSKRR